MYKVFVRNFWKQDYYGILFPATQARRYTIRKDIETEAEAIAICKKYNDTHDPGVLSRKAEYESYQRSKNKR